jgi:hypothetical protein
MSLVDATFEWLEKEWSDEVDFVIWTGDNARCVSCLVTNLTCAQLFRHDIDRSLPRTPKEIFSLNEAMVAKMRKAFPGIPVVPSRSQYWKQRYLPTQRSRTRSKSRFIRILKVSKYHVLC